MSRRSNGSENSEACDEYAALSPKSLSHYLSSLRQVLDFADVQPNPARSPKVKLPTQATKEEVSPPSSVEWQAIKAKISKPLRLVVRFIECEGVRISEALALTYGDVDFTNSRIRVSKARTKGRTAGQRWLPVPTELMDDVAELIPLEDRDHDRRVFAGIAEHIVRQGLNRACRDAGIAAYSSA